VQREKLKNTGRVEISALSEGREQRANPPSGTTTKKNHQQWGLCSLRP